MEKKPSNLKLNKKNYDKIEFKVYALADSNCVLYTLYDVLLVYVFGTTLLSLQVRKYIYHQLDMAGECISQ